MRGFDQLIVISHDDTFEQGLDSIIRLHKENGETHVITDDEVMEGIIAGTATSERRQSLGDLIAPRGWRMWQLQVLADYPPSSWGVIMGPYAARLARREGND